MRQPMVLGGRLLVAATLAGVTGLAQAQLTPAQSLLQDKFVFNLGVHYMKLSQQLSGTATFTDANGVTSAASFVRKENSIPVPLPVIGARVAWAFAPQWVLEGQGQLFKADISGYDGRVTDLRAGVTWMFSQNFGAGVG